MKLFCLLIAPPLLCAVGEVVAAVQYPYSNVGPQNATLSIDTSRATPFNHKLLGLNTNFPENQYGSDGYNDADAQALITAWSPPALRFPHGVWSNFYDWEVDGRRIYDGYTGTYYNAVVNVPNLRYGFDGFKTLHDNLGFDVLHTWNVNYDSPEKGVRRLQDRTAKGFDVKRIELGNETFWVNQRSEAVDTPEKYVAVAQAHSQALKAEDPQIQISVPVTWRTGGIHTPWNNALAADQTYYDAVTLHKYIRPGDSTAGLQEVLNARTQMIETAQSIRTQFPGKPIWLSEWSVDAGDNAISVLGQSDVYLGLIDRPDLFDSAEYFQIHNHDPLVTYDKSANPKHRKTTRGAAYDILRNVFLGSQLLTEQLTTSQIAPGLDAASAKAVLKDGELVVYAVNKSPVSVPLSLHIDNAFYQGAYTHDALQFNDVNDFPRFDLGDTALTAVAPGPGGIVLPPLSISVISGFSRGMPGDYQNLIAGWDTWSEVAPDTWVATQADSVTAQAVGTPEAGGVWFNFSNATVENGASSDGQYGALGPAGASTSVALPTDAVTLSNGFDGSIDFTLTDTSGIARALTGFHFDIGAFRPNAATDWELEVLAGGDLTAGLLASGTATVNAGPIQDDITIDLTRLSDSTLDANGTVTFRLSFTGGGGESGAPANGHHLFLDNVGVTGLPLGLPGDFDGDGDVDGADLLDWQRNHGTAADLVAWQANYGATRLLVNPSAAVPEPGALVLIACTMLPILVAGRYPWDRDGQAKSSV
jgi:hypothetical protein